jgi:ATP-dependent helicase HrpA
MTLDVLSVVRRILPLANTVQRELDAAPPSTATNDMAAQLKGLIYPGFIARIGRSRLTALERYLTAMQRRLERVANDPSKDTLAMATLQDMQKAYADALAALPAGTRPSDELLDVRWMLEELRVSLFAQPMRTAYPVSPERIFRVLDAAGS